jgi:hypothetical protein
MAGIFLLGPVGCGKTHLAVGLCRALWAAGRSALLLNEPAYVEMVRRSYDDKNGAAKNATDELKELALRVSVLVLDDLGRAYTKPDGSDDASPTSNQWYRDTVLFPILDHRCNMGAPVVVTTNRPRLWLEKHISNMIASPFPGVDSLEEMTKEEVKALRVAILDHRRFGDWTCLPNRGEGRARNQVLGLIRFFEEVMKEHQIKPSNRYARLQAMGYILSRDVDSFNDILNGELVTLLHWIECADPDTGAFHYSERAKAVVGAIMTEPWAPCAMMQLQLEFPLPYPLAG